MINIKSSVKNLISVILILIGTFIGAKGHDYLLAGSGYNYKIGLTLGVVIFGVVSLSDLALELLRSAWFAIKIKRNGK